MPFQNSLTLQAAICHPIAPKLAHFKFCAVQRRRSRALHTAQASRRALVPAVPLLLSCLASQTPTAHALPFVRDVTELANRLLAAYGVPQLSRAPQATQKVKDSAKGFSVEYPQDWKRRCSACEWGAVAPTVMTAHTITMRRACDAAANCSAVALLVV